jgi:hypothetical protein
MVRVHWAGEQRGNLDYKGWIYPRKRSGEGADETDQVCFNLSAADLTFKRESVVRNY